MAEKHVVVWLMDARRFGQTTGRAKRNEREAQEQLKSKELVIMDLTKKCTELNNKLKEYSALYDIVKNDRNKHVNQIQVGGPQPTHHVLESLNMWVRRTLGRELPIK